MKKVLVVDDDNGILESISLVLEDAGYGVDALSKGSETIEKAARFKPDVILLDVLMSGSDGREICRAMKQHEILKHIPIIMMSAHPSAKRTTKESGADAYIDKPFDTRQLLSIINRFIN